MWIHHDPSIFICRCHVHFNVTTLRGTREKCFLQGVGPAEIEGYGMERRAAKLMAGGSTIINLRISKTHIDIYRHIRYNCILFIHSFKLFSHSLTVSFVHSFIHPSVHSFTHSFMQCFMTEGYLVGFDTLFEFNTCPLVSLQPDICKIHRIPIDSIYLPMDIPRCWL